MKTYPIMLNLTARRCVVVGAGSVGQRKAQSLHRAGADVLVVDPNPPADFSAEGIELVRAPYEKRLLAGASLVFACTDDAALNTRVATDARSAGAMVNVADRPEECDFLAPAVVADGEVVVAVGTGGAAPALAGTIRDRLAGHLPRRVGEFAAALGQVRQHLHRHVQDSAKRGHILKILAGEQGLRAFTEAGVEALLELAQQL